MLSIMGYCRKPGQTGLRYAGAMHPFSELADLPRRLQQPALRDLAWTLTSPALLLDAGIAQRHPLAGSHWADHPERLGAWLTQRGFGGAFDVQRRAEEAPVAEYLALAQALG